MPLNRENISSILISISALVPCMGVFTYCYTTCRLLYETLWKERGLIKTLKAKIEELKKENYPIERHPKIRRYMNVNPPSARFVLPYALLALFLDIGTLYVLRSLLNDCKKEAEITVSREKLTILFVMLWLIDGIVLGFANLAGLAFLILPSMSLMNVLWISGSVPQLLSMRLKLGLDLRYMPYIVTIWCIVKASALFLIYLRIFNNVMNIVRRKERLLSDLTKDLSLLEEAMTIKDSLLAVPPLTEISICPLCGSSIPKIARYCPYCGSNLLLE